MLEQDGADQVYRSREKWSVTKSKGGQEHPTNNKKKEGSWVGPALLKLVIEGMEREG
jgi:hypothetical protein